LNDGALDLNFFSHNNLPDVSASNPASLPFHFRTTLRVSHRAQVWSFFIKEKNIPKVVLDEVIGADMRCSVVNDDRQLVVVHKDDMKFFEADDIGPCSALEGTKKQVVFYKNYYVVVTEETKDVVAEKNTITVYDWRDRRNKFIAFQTQVRCLYESLIALPIAE
jgi:hypothetical protein